MEPALTLLAAAGIAAAVRILLRSFFRFATSGAETFVAEERARARERRGDLTAMQEAAHRANRARTARRRTYGSVALALLLLLAPIGTPWTKELYAAMSLLWLVPIGRTRASASGTGA